MNNAYVLTSCLVAILRRVALTTYSFVCITTCTNVASSLPSFRIWLYSRKYGICQGVEHDVKDDVIYCTCTRYNYILWILLFGMAFSSFEIKIFCMPKANHFRICRSHSSVVWTNFLLSGTNFQRDHIATETPQN